MSKAPHSSHSSHEHDEAPAPKEKAAPKHPTEIYLMWKGPGFDPGPDQMNWMGLDMTRDTPVPLSSFANPDAALSSAEASPEQFAVHRPPPDPLEPA
jgi:hypothetical protein